MKVIKLISCLSVLLLCSCSTIEKKVGLSEDCIAEEICEGAIENYFNLPSGFLDFTPSTSEEE
jgi:hypothetical protein